MMETGLLWNGSEFISVAADSEIFNTNSHESIVIWSKHDENNYRREFWLIELPRNVPSLVEAWDPFNPKLEISRKRRFDCIEELHFEVAKRAKRTPLKLGILGNLTRKRRHELTDDPSAPSSILTLDPGQESYDHKKQKEAEYSKEELDTWIEELAASFGDCMLGLGEAVPQIAPKSP